jgi:flagellar basal body-associated protein FliL
MKKVYAVVIIIFMLPVAMIPIMYFAADKSEPEIKPPIAQIQPQTEKVAPQQPIRYNKTVVDESDEYSEFEIADDEILTDDMIDNLDIDEMTNEMIDELDR